VSSHVTPPAAAGPTRSGGRRRFERTPLRRTGTLGILLGIGIVILVLDQISKHWAESALEPLTPRPLVGDLLQLNLLYNSGAAWGMGSGITPVVTCLQIAIGIGVVVFALRSVRSAWYAVALGLVLGGALGNIHDRLLRAPGPFTGWVVDFLELPHWPIFNVADMAVVSGAVLVVLLGLLGVPTDPAVAEDDGDDEGEGAPHGPGTGQGPAERMDAPEPSDDQDHPTPQEKEQEQER
jgi:signal peptidase II